MSPKKQIVMTFLNAMETGDTSSFPEIIHPRYQPGIANMPRTTLEIMEKLNEADLMGIDKLIDRFSEFNRIWKDRKITIFQLVEESDTVIAYYSMEFTNASPLLGIEPTNKRVSVQSYHHFTFFEDKIVSIHMMQDIFSVIRQIGLEIYDNETTLLRDYLEAIKQHYPYRV